MLSLDLRAQSLGCDFASGLAGKSECIGDRFAKKRITKCQQDEPQGRVGNVMVLVADAELRNEVADRFQDSAERVAIPRQDHPGGEGAGSALAECVEGHVGDIPGVGLAGASFFDCRCDLAVHAVGHEACKLRLKPGCRTEMVEQVGVRLVDLGSDCLERDSLRSTFDQDSACRLERGGTAFFRAEAFASY